MIETFLARTVGLDIAVEVEDGKGLTVLQNPFRRFG